jgi:hypothetical protein
MCNVDGAFRYDRSSHDLSLYGNLPFQRSIQIDDKDGTVVSIDYSIYQIASLGSIIDHRNSRVALTDSSIYCGGLKYSCNRRVNILAIDNMQTSIGCRRKDVISILGRHYGISFLKCSRLGVIQVKLPEKTGACQ